MQSDGSFCSSTSCMHKAGFLKIQFSRTHLQVNELQVLINQNIDYMMQYSIQKMCNKIS